MIERQELHCHACDMYVQFNMDMELNGNHVLECPNCGHEHCRVVKDGIITGDRWDQRNGPGTVIYIPSTTTTATMQSVDYTNTATSSATAALWLNTGNY